MTFKVSESRRRSHRTMGHQLGDYSSPGTHT